MQHLCLEQNCPDPGSRLTSHKVSEGPTSESPEVPWRGELARALGHTPSWKVRVKGAHCHLQPLPWGPWACGNQGLCSASTPHLTEQFQAPLTEAQRRHKTTRGPPIQNKALVLSACQSR